MAFERNKWLVTLDFADGSQSRAISADREEIAASLSGMGGLVMKLMQKNGPVSITITTTKHMKELLENGQ